MSSFCALLCVALSPRSQSKAHSCHETICCSGQWRFSLISHLNHVLLKIHTEIRPWFNSTLNILASTFYNYLKGNKSSLVNLRRRRKFSNRKKKKKMEKYMKFPVGINIASNDKRSHGYPGQVYLSENDLKHHTAAAKYSSPSSAYLKSAILLLFTVYRRISSSPSTPCTGLGDHPNLMSWWPFSASFCRQSIAKS